MATFSELWPTVTGTDVIVWAAMDPKDTARRMALYKNRAGITGRMNGTQLEALGYTLADLPVVKTAEIVAAALRAGYPPNFNWNYFDFILSSAGSSSGTGDVDMTEVMAQVNATLDTRLSSVFVYKGSVTGLNDLPTTGNKQGDVYQVQDDSYAEYVWVEGDNAHWEYLGKTVDLSNYSSTAVMNAAIEVARLDAKRVYSATDLNIAGDTTQAWFESLASKVSSNLMSTDSLVIGGIRVSDLPDDLGNAEIMVRVIAGHQVCYYATIFSDTGVMYQLNISGSSYVWEKIAFNSYLTTHINDTTKHVTLVERNSWNAANTHINDTDVHVTAEQKTEWSGKQDAITVGTYATPADLTAIIMDKVFVREAASINLAVNTWYICSTALTGVLPSAPVDGSEIRASVVTGGEATGISAGVSDTINGSTDALSIDTANDTVTLIYDATAHNWLVL